MVNYSYEPIENQHDNMPNWYRPNIDPKVLKELMKRKDLPGLINNICFFFLMHVGMNLVTDQFLELDG